MSTHTSGGALSRRQAIAAASAAAVIPKSSVASIVDPHPAWLEEWFELDRIYWQTEHVSECAKLVPAIHHLGDLIVDTPATTREGVLAKILYIKTLYSHEANDNSPVIVLTQIENFIGTRS